MDQLWAPWRLAYVTADKDQPRTPTTNGCFLCHGLAAADDRANLIVLRTELSVVALNKFPYNNGHLLVCPRAHKGEFETLAADELLDLQVLLRRMMGVLKTRLSPDGFNVGLNLGRVAGAGLPGHLHWHIVPRWNGDTNFMPVLTDIRVIVQSLDALYDALTDELQKPSAAAPLPS